MEQNKELVFERVLTKQIYPGICNVCDSMFHSDFECEYGLIFYHATSSDYLSSILENGLLPHKGRLGIGIYCSDSMELCLKYIASSKKKLENPIILKFKSMASEVYSIGRPEQVSQIPDSLKSKIDAIKCPYFIYKDRTLYEYSLIHHNLKITGVAKVSQDHLKFREQPNISKQKKEQLRQYLKINKIDTVEKFKIFVAKQKKIKKLRDLKKQSPNRLNKLNDSQNADEQIEMENQQLSDQKMLDQKSQVTSIA